VIHKLLLVNGDDLVKIRDLLNCDFVKIRAIFELFCQIRNIMETSDWIVIQYLYHC